MLLRKFVISKKLQNLNIFFSIFKFDSFFIFDLKKVFDLYTVKDTNKLKKDYYFLRKVCLKKAYISYRKHYNFLFLID